MSSTCGRKKATPGGNFILKFVGAMDLTQILHNLEVAVLERKEENAVSSVEAFDQNIGNSGEGKLR